jgi:hypothetical protein
MSWNIQIGSDHARGMAPDLQSAFALISDMESARNTHRGEAVLLTSSSGAVHVLLEPESVSLDACS